MHAPPPTEPTRKKKPGSLQAPAPGTTRAQLATTAAIPLGLTPKWASLDQSRVPAALTALGTWYGQNREPGYRAAKATMAARSGVTGQHFLPPAARLGTPRAPPTHLPKSSSVCSVLHDRRNGPPPLPALALRVPAGRTVPPQLTMGPTYQQVSSNSHVLIDKLLRIGDFWPRLDFHKSERQGKEEERGS